VSTTIDPARVVGHKVFDARGHKIGQAEEVYLDDSSGVPQWVTVKGGLFGGKEHFAPLRGATMVADDLRLACNKEQVDSAPELETGRHLSVEEEMALYRHYGLGAREPAPQSGSPIGGTETAMGRDAAAAASRGGMPMDSRLSADKPMAMGTPPMATEKHMASDPRMASDPHMASDMRMQSASRISDTRMSDTRMSESGMTSESRMASGTRMAPDARMRDGEHVMMRFEERIHVSTERVEAGHARMRKYVTTELVEKTVPLMHQEVRIEREPIPAGTRAEELGTIDFAEAEQDVILYAERPVVTREAVPVERVRMRVEEVTEQVTVKEEIRRERIEFDDQGKSALKHHPNK
jgi:uncharacterized protein (TIGR02271 family)